MNDKAKAKMAEPHMDQYSSYIKYFRKDGQNNQALTQVIPMDAFEADEKNIRKFVKEINGRIYFRGPRTTNSSCTLRKNAKGIVIYAGSMQPIH